MPIEVDNINIRRKYHAFTVLFLVIIKNKIDFFFPKTGA